MENQAEDDDHVEVKKRFNQLCREVNMDSDTEEKAWGNFVEISRKYTLEGDSLYWLACAVYVAARRGVNILSGTKKSTIEGNGISLSKLLGAVKLSLLHFFLIIRKWLKMGDWSHEISDKVDRLERNFSVASVVFEKFTGVFSEMFQIGWSENRKRGRRKQSIKSTDLMNFCWTLYIRAKALYPDISDDLVNSYHLLLSCLDLMYANAISLRQLKSALNQAFPGLPANYMEEDYSCIQPPSVIEQLCQLHAGLPIETRIIKQQYLKTFIEEEIKKGALKGDSNHLMGLLDASNFDYNFRSLDAGYESHILCSGNIDERVFIKEDASVYIGTPTKQYTTFPDIDEKERSHVKRNLQEYFNKAKGFVPLTPFTGHQWVKDKDPGPAGSSIVTQSASRLQELLKGLQPAPSDSLKKMFDGIEENPGLKLEEQLDNLSKRFLQEYAKSLDGSCTSDESMQVLVETHLRYGNTLFYKVLENIVTAEKKRSLADQNLATLLHKDVFIRALYACCLEIVMFSVNSSRTFPWLLRVLDLHAYDFFKVIEVVIREEENLSRDVVKHLSRVEEQILERLAWKTGSPVYSAIQDHGIPQCQDVSCESATPYLIMSPLRQGTGTPRSPIIQLRDRSVAPQAGSAARRTLFSSPEKNQTGASSPIVKPGSAIILPSTRITVSQTGQPIVRIPFMFSSPGSSPVRLVAVTPSRGTPPRQTMIRIASPTKNTKKFGSLGIFFRKLYHMASLRMKDLSGKLGITAGLQQKIWTCFEHSLVKNIELLRDRHVDQLIMCAVYVMSKVTKEDKSFHEIMKFYRTQPQASSEVYRHVLVERASDRDSEAHRSTGSDQDKGCASDAAAHSASSARTEIAGDALGKDSPAGDGKFEMNRTGVQVAVKEEKPCDDAEKRSRGDEDIAATCKYSDDDSKSTADVNVYDDLIQFYNLVYIRRIKDFALKFATAKVNLDAPPLSPLPVSRRQNLSPRKVSKKHEVYISPIKPSMQMTPRSRLLYCFDSSPSGKLRDINDMVNSRGVSGIQRRMNFDQDEDNGPTPAKRAAMSNGMQRSLQKLQEDQRQKPKDT